MCHRVSGYIKHAKSSPNCSIVAGGGFDDSVGYFIEPTVVQTSTPEDKIFQEEIFGPVVTVYVYKDAEAKESTNGEPKEEPQEEAKEANDKSRGSPVQTQAHQ